jgi:hypothetical protein
MNRKSVLIPACAVLAVLVLVFAGLWISNLTHSTPSQSAVSAAHSAQVPAPSSAPGTPSASATVPSASAAVPSASATVPSASAAVPSASAAAPSAVATASSAPRAPALTNPVAVVTQFYADIANGDYSDAWALGGDNIGGPSYPEWVNGYATTATIDVTSSGLTGSDTVWADISATQDNGSVNTYSGTYTVVGGVITSADIVQTS